MVKVYTGAGATPYNWYNTAVVKNNFIQNTPPPPTMNTELAAPQQQPQQKSLGSLFTDMRTTLGQPPRVEAPATAPKVGALFANQKPIQGLGSDYFNNMRTQMADNLRREYYGPLGTAQQMASQESAAGRLDSGVGQRVMEESVARPFASGLVDIETNILQKQMEEAARVETANQGQDQFRQQILANIYASDSANAMEAAKANTQLATRFSEIASDMAKYERGEISEQEMFNKKMEFDSIVAEIQNANQAMQNQWGMSQEALTMDTWVPQQIDEWKRQGLSFEQVIDQMKSMMKAGGGVNYQPIYNMAEVAFGRPVTNNVEMYNWPTAG
jgi:ribosome-binding protein aMBF1 (putative translation factor)